ncbi:MAG: IPTL-CTERM sorting domain-containing protein [Gammaproteobacteria bacterium]
MIAGLLTGLVASSAVDAATTTFSYSGPVVPIPDAADLSGTNPGAQVGAPIAVSGLSGVVLGVTLSIDGTVCTTTAGSTTVGIDHTFVNDLELTLRSPNGTDVLVVNNTDGGGNNFCQVVLDDAAGVSIQTVVTAQAPFTGTWAPNAPLSTFVGETPNGSWTLLAQDFFSQDTGNIRAWSITITDGPIPPRVGTAVTAVPTLSQFGMIILSFLLSWVGYSSLRRKCRGV